VDKGRRKIGWMLRESSRFHRDSFVDDDDSIQGSRDEMLDGEQAPTKIKAAVTKETRNVQMWRVAVILMLLIAGASTSALTYILLHGEEEEDFETSVRMALLYSVPFNSIPLTMALYTVLSLCGYDQRCFEGSYCGRQPSL
jgi:hypothetical protein